VASSLLRHQTNVTEFFLFGPIPIKISGYTSAVFHLQNKIYLIFNIDLILKRSHNCIVSSWIADSEK